MGFITVDWQSKFGVGTAVSGPHSTSSVQETHWNLEPHRKASSHTKIHMPKLEERELSTAATLARRAELLPFHMLRLLLSPERLVWHYTNTDYNIQYVTGDFNLTGRECFTTSSGKHGLISYFSLLIIYKIEKAVWFCNSLASTPRHVGAPCWLG